MPLDFADLPAVSFKPPAVRTLPRLARSTWDGVFLGLDGEILLRLKKQELGWLLLSENGEELPLRRPSGARFFIPFVQRFVDGRWLVVEDTGPGGNDNAFVFDPDGKLSHSFYAGWGFVNIQVDAAGGIWIGYFDEGVIGGEERLGRNGLIRLNQAGEVDFRFNARLRQLGEVTGASEIFDIYAFTVDDRSRAWLCPYTEFFLAYVDRNDIKVVLAKAPVPGADAIAVGEGYVAFFDGYDAPGVVTIVELETQRLRIIQLLGDGKEPLPLRYLTTKGPAVAAVVDDQLLRLDLGLLLVALGPWHDNNSSTVASSLKFREEQARGRPGGIMIQTVPKQDLR